MSAAHVLVVTAVPCPEDDYTTSTPCAGCQERPDLRYDIECPGVTDNCRTWWGGPCSGVVCLIHPHRDHDYDELVAHGKRHQRLNLDWHVESDQCLAHTMDSAHESAQDLDRPPGRYEVDLDVDYDSIELSLRSVAPWPLVGTLFALPDDDKVYAVSRVVQGFVGWCTADRYTPPHRYSFMHPFASATATVDEWAARAEPADLPG